MFEHLDKKPKNKIKIKPGQWVLSIIIPKIKDAVKKLKKLRLMGIFSNSKDEQIIPSDSKPMSERTRKFKTSGSVYPGNLLSMEFLDNFLPEYETDRLKGIDQNNNLIGEISLDKSSLKVNSKDENIINQTGKWYKKCVFMALSAQSRPKRGRGGKKPKEVKQEIDFSKLKSKETSASKVVSNNKNKI